ncbi:MAG: hypothetical protein ACRD3O_12200, partial [Terriglobia bacterium]
MNVTVMHAWQSSVSVEAGVYTLGQWCGTREMTPHPSRAGWRKRRTRATLSHGRGKNQPSPLCPLEVKPY